MGPSLDLVMRRTHLASDDLYKLSLKQPKALKVRSWERMSLPELSVKNSKSWRISYCLIDQSLLLYSPTEISEAMALLPADIQGLLWEHKTNLDL